MSPDFTSTASAALRRALVLEWTDSKQLASRHPALAQHQAVHCSQNAQKDFREALNWQPQSSQAEHSLRDEPTASGDKQQDLNPLGDGAVRPDVSQPMPSIQAPPFALLSGASAIPGVEVGGIQSSLTTMTPTTHVGAAALQELCQPAHGRGDAPNMQRPAASGLVQQLPVDMSQPAAAQMLQQEAPPPDGSAQPGQWRTKHRTAAQLDGSKQAASATSLQHNEGGRCAEDEAEMLKGCTQAHHPCAAEGAAAMQGSWQRALEDTVQAESTPPWLPEQVTALALDGVMA